MNNFLQDLSSALRTGPEKKAPLTRLMQASSTVEDNALANGKEITLQAIFRQRIVLSKPQIANVEIAAKQQLVEQIAYEVYREVRDDLNRLVSDIMETLGPRMDYYDMRELINRIYAIEKSTHPS